MAGRYVSLYVFDAKEPGSVSLQVGDTVVVSRIEEGWGVDCDVTRAGASVGRGAVPMNYLKPEPAKGAPPPIPTSKRPSLKAVPPALAAAVAGTPAIAVADVKISVSSQHRKSDAAGAPLPVAGTAKLMTARWEDAVLRRRVAQQPAANSAFSDPTFNKYGELDESDMSPAAVARRASLGSSSPPASPSSPQPLLSSPTSSSSDKPAIEKIPKGPGVATAESLTKYGIYATNMGRLASVGMAVTGLMALWWSGVNSSKYGTTYTGIGLYGLIVGILMFVYETQWGLKRRADIEFPIRALVYILCAIPAFLTIPTQFAGQWYVFTGIMHLISTLKKEQYEVSERPPVVKKTEDLSHLGCGDRIRAWWRMKQEQDKVGLVGFLFMYFSANVIIFWVTFDTFEQKYLHPDPGTLQLSGWVPWAKGFGTCLDFNIVLLLVPVSRTAIRWLLDRSTADQTCTAKVLRVLLFFFPLDRCLQMHELIGVVTMGHVVGHVICHLANYVNAEDNTWTRYGAGPWVTGGGMMICMLFLYSATFKNIRTTQFEIFWYSHHFFVPFFLFNLIHGGNPPNWWGPNFWKWLLFPGSLYMFERCYREWSQRQAIGLVSVTHMDKVFCVEFAKVGPLQEFHEGQYVFLNCPFISKTEWHPFTISSAPQDNTFTCHIRIMSDGSWTRAVANYLKLLGKGAVHCQFTEHNAAGAVVPGKTTGPDGQQLFRVYGPHWAPTQRLSSYSTAMVISTGIGVTPLVSAMKSIIHHRWKYSVGQSFPDHAWFGYVCSYAEIDLFRWFLRTVKEADDGFGHLLASNPQALATKSFAIHIFITSAPEPEKRQNFSNLQLEFKDEEEDTAFWGQRRRDDRNVQVRHSDVSERALYLACKNPGAAGSVTKLGPYIHIYNGRPKWSDHFAAMTAVHKAGSDVGVLFCGNPLVATDLKEQCKNASSVEANRFFRLHKENF